jgi:hypothetical protein
MRFLSSPKNNNNLAAFASFYNLQILLPLHGPYKAVSVTFILNSLSLLKNFFVSTIALDNLHL